MNGKKFLNIFTSNYVHDTWCPLSARVVASIAATVLILLTTILASVAYAQDTWMKHTIDASLSGAEGVFVYDIDGDNNPDVVATGYNSGEVVWYKAPDDPTQVWTELP